MYIVIITSFLCLLFTFLESKGHFKRGMLWGFICITVLGCIHYNYGNDYMSYYGIAETVKNTPFSWQAIWSGEMYREPGWVLLNYLFKPIGGFFVMVAVLNIIQNVCVYQFIRRTVKKEWATLAVFIYLFSAQYYLINFSMMRQGLVVCVFLGVWPLIRDRKFWITLPLFYLLSTIHHSALILLPFTFWGYIKVFNLKVFGLVFLSLILLFWLNESILNQVFELLMSGGFEQYAETYQDSVNSGNKGLGFVLYQIPLVVNFIYFFRKDKSSNEEKSLVSLAMIGAVAAPFSQIIQLAGRMAIYFKIYGLFATPCVYSKINNAAIRYVLLSLYVFIILIDYFKFFADPGWFLHYGTFHTIFEAI